MKSNSQLSRYTQRHLQNKRFFEILRDEKSRHQFLNIVRETGRTATDKRVSKGKGDCLCGEHIGLRIALALHHTASDSGERTLCVGNTEYLIGGIGT